MSRSPVRWLLLALLAACHGGGGARPDGAGGADGSAAPPPLDTPENTWTWVEIPGTTCANGTPVGIGVNRTSASDDLFVYFEGGGACWDALSCFTEKTAVNIDVTYDATTFATDIGTSPVDRSPGNPFAAATFVWVPYCTGDLHAGDNVIAYDDHGTTRTVHHTGAVNTQLDIDALRGAFPAAAHVWIAGSSAGGFGATFGLDHFVAAWPSAGVHLLQDSSPFVPPLVNYSVWQTSWKLAYPAGCTSCATSFPAVIDTLAAAHPTSRIGLLTFDDDAVISGYFGYTTSLVPATTALVDMQYAHANTRAFVVAGTSHTMLGQLGSLVGPGGVHLSDWVTQWATGDAAWATVKP